MNHEKHEKTRKKSITTEHTEKMEDEMTDFLLKNGRFFQKDYFRELLERAVTTFFDYIILEGYGSVSPKKTEEKPIRPLNNSRAQRKRRRP